MRPRPPTGQGWRKGGDLPMKQDFSRAKISAAFFKVNWIAAPASVRGHCIRSLDPAAITLDKGPDNEQPEPLPALAGLPLFETVKDNRFQVIGNTGAVIAHHDLDRLSRLFDGDINDRPSPGKFCTVPDQVDEDLAGKGIRKDNRRCPRVAVRWYSGTAGLNPGRSHRGAWV